jgi:phosphate transport system permease protein
MTTAAIGSAISAATLRGNPRRRRKEAIVRGLLLGAAAFSLAVSVAIVVALVGRAIGFLAKVDLGTLFGGTWRPRQNQFDIPSLLIGSFVVTAIAMVVAVPLGLGTAMFLSEYAHPRVRRLLKPVLETLAGIPSVVIGFFALTVINPAIVKGLLGATSTFTVMAAGIGVGILTIPLVASISEDAMHAVPDALREAAYGIGARRRTVTTHVVIPAAVSGIVAAVILAVSRALGETMVVAVAAGGVGAATRTWNPLVPGQTMTAAIASLATGSDVAKSGTVGGVNPFDSLYFVALLLFVLTLGLNLASERFVRRYRRVY